MIVVGLVGRAVLVLEVGVGGENVVFLRLMSRESEIASSVNI